MLLGDGHEEPSRLRNTLLGSLTTAGSSRQAGSGSTVFVRVAASCDPCRHRWTSARWCTPSCRAWRTSQRAVRSLVRPAAAGAVPAVGGAYPLRLGREAGDGRRPARRAPGEERALAVAEPGGPQVVVHRLEGGPVLGAHPVQPDRERHEHVADVAHVLRHRPHLAARDVRRPVAAPAPRHGGARTARAVRRRCPAPRRRSAIGVADGRTRRRRGSSPASGGRSAVGHRR